MESSPASSPILQNPSPTQWRYTWESLAHIPILRLYIFSPSSNFSPSQRCRNLSVALRRGSDKSILVVTFSDEGEEEAILQIPVPRVLIDPGSPIDYFAREDHVEVKLVLLLPVDHPVVKEIRGGLYGCGEEKKDLLERFDPLVLDSDLKTLSTRAVEFFCRTCSTKLTKQPLRHFVEMPSMNWQEAADNWFGACCCSFGGVSEKLVSQYVKTYVCKKGTCLLDAASIIICKGDLEGYDFESSSDAYPNDDLLAKSGMTSSEKIICCVNSSDGISESCEKSISNLSKFKSMTTNCDNNLSKSDCSSLQPSACCDNNTQGTLSSYKGANFSCEGISQEIQYAMASLNVHSSHCVEDYKMSHADSCEDKFPVQAQHYCHDEKVVFPTEVTCLAGASAVAATVGDHKHRILLRDNALGSGFMIRTSNLSSDIEWTEFLCKNCSTPIGVYPSSRIRDCSLDGGIRLLKCYVSTSPLAGGPEDIFRQYTLQKLFVNLLLENAIDELSFRTIVRDLKTKDPMLQILLLNSKAWSVSGCCLQNCSAANDADADLLPVVKVLFTDSNFARNEKQRTAEDWSGRNNVEEVFMMRYQVNKLRFHLNSSLELFPASCSSLQGMSLSSLGR